MSPVRLAVVVAVVLAAAMTVPRYAPELFEPVLAERTPERSVPERSAAPPAATAAVGRRDEDRQRSRPTRNDGGTRVVIDADRRGQFVVDASFNGRAMQALVDTGASTVALTAESARRLGISPFRGDYTTIVSTANGTIRAAPVTLTEVRVGGIRLRNVDALVMPSGALPANLLGMNFLSRLSKFEFAGRQLVLVQ